MSVYEIPRNLRANVYELFDVEPLKEQDFSWYALVAPKVVLFLSILILPFFAAIWISLHEWNPIAAQHPFVGLDNYRALLNDPIFHKSVINTTGYALGMLAFNVPISLGIALLLDKNLRGTKFYSAAIFLPVVTSLVVVSLIWKLVVLHPESGLANNLLGAIGLPTFEWLQNTDTALASIVIMAIWKTVGFNMVIFLAGLRSIPDTYYEAARIDGANAYQRFRHVTLPLLKPTTFFVVIIELSSSFRVFTSVFVLTQGGPVHSSYTIVFHFYRKGFAQFHMGYASAIAVVLFTVIFAVTLVQWRYWGGDVEY